MPVSFSVWSSVAVCFAHDAISWSISVSVGMKGSLVSGFMCGRFHVLPVNLRKASYISACFLCVNLFHCWWLMIVAFAASVSWRSVILASCFSVRMRDMIVVSASPFFFMSIAKLIRSWVVFAVEWAG